MQSSKLAGSLCLAAAAFAAVEARAATNYTASQVVVGVNAFPVDLNASGKLLGGRPSTATYPPDTVGSVSWFRQRGATNDNLAMARPFQMNDAGETAGNTVDGSNLLHAVRGSDASGPPSLIDLGTLPGHTQAEGRGINNAGQVAGTSYGASASRAFRSTPSNQANALTDLGTLPGQTSSTGNAINGTGQVAGSSGKHVFRSSDNSSPVALTDLGAFPNNPFGGPYPVGAVTPTAINSAGQVVGYSEGPAQRLADYAFVSSKNGDPSQIYYIFPTVGSSNGRATDINGNSEVVGYGFASGTGSPNNALYFHNGITRNLNNYLLNTTGAYTIRQANAINDSGVIAVTADGTSPSIKVTSWLLTPTSFTNSLSLFAGGSRSVVDNSSYNPVVPIASGTSAVFDTLDNPTTGGVMLTGVSSIPAGGQMIVLLDLINPSQAVIDSMVPDVGQASFTILSDASSGTAAAQWDSVKSLYGVGWDAAVVYAAPTGDRNFAWDFTANQSVGVDHLAVVPEPASLALLAAPAAIARRRRRRSA